MEKFVVRKNTLPYVHQWAVVDSTTGNKVGDYKTREIAQQACDQFIEHGLLNGEKEAPKKLSAFDAMKQRMQKPAGDQPRPTPKHSNKRPVELD